MQSYDRRMENHLKDMHSFGVIMAPLLYNENICGILVIFLTDRMKSKICTDDIYKCIYDIIKYSTYAMELKKSNELQNMLFDR